MGSGAFDGLTAQLDWYSIEIVNAISSLSANDVLRACYSAQFNPSGNPGSAACSLVMRNPATGGISDSPAFGISQANENIALLETSGVDLGLNYRLSTPGLGAFRFSLLGTYVLETTRQ